MSKHTPGPWQVIAEDGPGIRVYQRKVKGHHGAQIATRIHTMQDAQLIATAPEMAVEVVKLRGELEALAAVRKKEAADFLKHLKQVEAERDKLREEIKRLRVIPTEKQLEGFEFMWDAAEYTGPAKEYPVVRDLLSTIRVMLDKINQNKGR